MPFDNELRNLTEAVSVRGREYTFYNDWCLTLPEGFAAYTERENADLLVISGNGINVPDYERAPQYLHIRRAADAPDTDDLLRHDALLLLEHSLLAKDFFGDKDRDYILRRESDFQIYCQLASFQRVHGGYGFAMFRLQVVTLKGIYAVRMGFRYPADMAEYQKQLIAVVSTFHLADGQAKPPIYLERFFDLDTRLDMTCPPADEHLDERFRRSRSKAAEMASLLEMGVPVGDPAAYALTRIEDIEADSFPLTESARRCAKVFRTEEHALQELYHGVIRNAAHFTALRSFWWCVQEYAVQISKPVGEFALADILAIAQLIESRGCCNYDDNYADELCCVPDMKAIYLPDAAFCKELQEEGMIKENALRLGWFMADLNALRTQLEELRPLMEQIAGWLTEQGESAPLHGIQAKLLHTWCVLTFAADAPFAVTGDIPDLNVPASDYAPACFVWEAHMEDTPLPSMEDPLWNAVSTEITRTPDVPINDDTIENLANVIANALRSALQGTPAGNPETVISPAGIACAEDTVVTAADWCITIPAGWRYSIDPTENGERVLVAGLDDATLRVADPFDATINFSVTNPLEEDLEGYPLDAPEMAATIQRLQMLSGEAVTLRSDQNMILNYRFHFRDANADGTVWYKHGGFIVTRMHIYAFQMFNKQAKSQQEADKLLEHLLLGIRLPDEEAMVLDVPEIPMQAEPVLSDKELHRGERFDLSGCTAIDLGLEAGGMEADAFVFLLDKAGKASDDADLVFYGNPESANGAVSITRKNGKKRIHVKLAELPEQVQKIMLYFSADEDLKELYFKETPDAAAVIEENGTILCHLDLTDLPAVRTLAAMELYRYRGNWKARAVGAGSRSDIAALCGVHGLEVEE